MCKVEQIKANQFCIKSTEGIFFQSYQTVIAKYKDGKITLSKDWNFSRTTTRYLLEWFINYTHCYFTSKKELEKEIKYGRIEVVDVLV